MLFAGRFGLAPSANRKATAGLKLEVRDSGLQTGDPAGFTLADTLACGSMGHIIGVGIVLTTKKWTVFDVLKPWSKKPRQNFLTWQKLKRQKS
jgi:photosystem I subunit 10